MTTGRSRDEQRGKLLAFLGGDPHAYVGSDENAYYRFAEGVL